MDELDKIYDSVLTGKAPETKLLVEEMVSQGSSVNVIISTMNAAMEEVGRRFSRNEIFLPEMMVAARAMKFGMDILEPLIVGNAEKTKGKIVIGTIKGDLHDIGKNLVAMMFKSAGFNVVDIGVDVPKEGFLEAIRAESPNLCAISALLTTVLTNVTEAISFLKTAGVTDTCKLMVGGAAIDGDFAAKSGADGYSDDAGEAVQVAKRLIGIT
jgi:5-methyltetrahydrofolate--homocysteine methyltransferase